MLEEMKMWHHNVPAIVRVLLLFPSVAMQYTIVPFSGVVKLNVSVDFIGEYTMSAPFGILGSALHLRKVPSVKIQV